MHRPAPCAASHAGHVTGMRIVVTGATGNVGSQLLPQLLSPPPSPPSSASPGGSPPSATRREWHAVDVAEGDLRPLVRGADVVVHLAWLLQPAHDPDEMRRVNVPGTRRVFDAVGGGGRARARLRLIGRHVRPGPKSAARRRGPAERASRRRPTAATRPRSRRCSTTSSASTPSAASCGCGPASCSRRGGERVRRLLPRPVRAGRWCARSCCRLVPVLARARFQAVHADDIAARTCWRDHPAGAGRVQHRRRAGARPADAGPPARCTDRPGADAALVCARAAASTGGCRSSRPTRAGSTSARDADHGHLPCADGARLGARAHVGRRAPWSCSTGSATSGATAPRSCGHGDRPGPAPRGRPRAGPRPALSPTTQAGAPRAR